jgi:hypothetical protein
MTKKYLQFFCLAITADTEKVQPMIQNLKISFIGDLLFHIIQTIQVRIYIFFYNHLVDAVDNDSVEHFSMLYLLYIDRQKDPWQIEAAPFFPCTKTQNMKHLLYGKDWVKYTMPLRQWQKIKKILPAVAGWRDQT